MKTIKENWVLVMISVLFVGFYFLSAKMDIYNQNTIKKIESEKDVLKSNVAIKEIEVKKLRTEKAEIVKDYGFDLAKYDKIIEYLQDSPQVIEKPVIRYRTKIITKTTPQIDLWHFSSDMYFDFSKYVKLDKEQDFKTDKIITDLKTINTKSEFQNSLKNTYIKKLKKKNKKTIIIAVLAVVGIFVFK